MSKDQIEVQKRIIAQEKAKIAPKRCQKKVFLKRYLKELTDPSHLIT